MREIWSDMKARANMNIMLCGSMMCEGEGKKGNKECTMQRQWVWY